MYVCMYVYIYVYVYIETETETGNLIYRNNIDR